MDVNIIFYAVLVFYCNCIFARPLHEGDNLELGPYYGGDILNPPRRTRSGVATNNMRWPDRTFVYKISPDFFFPEKSKITAAMKEIQDKTKCIKFREANSQDVDYALIRKGNAGCSAHLGRIGGEQQVNLASGCLQKNHGVAMHELIHGLGFDHEHNRPDRDDHVKILFDRVKPEAKFAFDKDPRSRTFNLPYDYGSIMHYKQDAFASKAGETTIIVNKKAAQIGQREKLSPVDVQKLRALYEC